MEIFIGIVVVLLIVFIMGYNKVVGLKEAVFTDQEGINVQLDERNKLFDSLINTVKKYMEHESDTFSKIVELRNNVKEDSSHASEEKLSKYIASGELASGLNITMEAYPDLKSSSNMLQLQESIENIERKLANSKKAFNMSIEDYNSYVEGIPGLFIVMIASNLKFKFERWTLEEQAAKKAEEKTVSF